MRAQSLSFLNQADFNALRVVAWVSHSNEQTKLVQFPGFVSRSQIMTTNRTNSGSAPTPQSPMFIHLTQERR